MNFLFYLKINKQLSKIQNYFKNLFKFKIQLTQQYKFTMKLNLFIQIVVLCFIFSIKSEVNFEKHIWVFWNGQIQHAPLLMRTCYQKIKIVCKQQGYNITLLSEENVGLYISNFQQYQHKVKNKKIFTIQSITDLIRLTILEQHGGIWLDLSSILMKGLKWIENIQQNPQLITNRNPSLNKSPDMMLFYIFLYQNSNEQRNEDDSMVNIFPGFESWFIAAKKNSRVISLWKKYFSEFFVMDFQSVTYKLSSQNIYIRYADNSVHYLAIHKAIYYMMQKQQLQLDKNLTLFSQRQNVNTYLNIWGLHGQYGPLAIETKVLQSPISLLNKDKQQLKQEQFQLRFFLKMTSSGRIQIEKHLNHTRDIVRQGKSFQQYLANKPKRQQCQDFQFIVEDSVIHFLIKNNPMLEHLNLFTITKQQRSRWKSYCHEFQYNSPQKSYSLSEQISQQNFFNILKKFINIDTVTLVSREAIKNLQLYQDSDTSPIKKISKFFEIRQSNLAVTRVAITMIACMTFIIGIGPLCTQISKITFHFIYKKYKKQQFSIFKAEDMQKNIAKSALNYIIQFLSFILYVACIINSYRISFTQAAFGFFDQQFIILVSMAVSYFSLKRYQQLCPSQKKIPIFISALSNKQFLNASFPFLCFYYGNSIVFSIQKRPEKLATISTLICLVLPVLIKLGKHLSSQILQNQRPANRLLKLILKYQYLNIYFAFGWMILIILIPNVKFLANSNGYLSHHVINASIIYTCIVYLVVLMQVLNKIIQKLRPQTILRRKSDLNKNNSVVLIRIITSLIVTSYLVWISYIIYYQPINEQIYLTQKFPRYQSTIIFSFMCINLLVSFQWKHQVGKYSTGFNISKCALFIIAEIIFGCALFTITFSYFNQIINFFPLTIDAYWTRKILVVFSIFVIVWNRVIGYAIKNEQQKGSQQFLKTIQLDELDIEKQQKKLDVKKQSQIDILMGQN